MPTRLWDFKCDTCGAIQANVVITTHRIPPSIPCRKCSSEATWAPFTSNHIHETHSWRYGKYDEALDCVVESRGHLKRILKEKGLQEASDPIRGNRKHSEEARHKARPRTETPMEWGSAEPTHP